MFNNIFQNVLNNVERFLQKMEYVKLGIFFLRNYRLFHFFQSDSGQWEEFMQLVFPDDEAVQPHLKLLAMAKRWKKGQEDTPATTASAPPPPSNTTTENTTTSTTSAEDDDEPLPASRIDDEEMNDES